MMKQINLVTIKNSNRIKNSIERDSFTCLKLNIPNNGEWIKQVSARAKKIMPHLNLGQANTSAQRSLSMVEIDNLSGLIAEAACDTMLRLQYGEENIIKPSADSSVNQIDIKLVTGKSIEVRSSCVRNGIDFAIFARDSNNGEQQYFDVIGPYSNAYKPEEQFKDYYMRVLYWCDKKQFMNLLDGPSLQLYITGGATKTMMCDPELYQNKHLLPAGGQVQVESDYRVIPLGKSLDAQQFFDIIAKENGFISRHEFNKL